MKGKIEVISNYRIIIQELNHSLVFKACNLNRVILHQTGLSRILTQEIQVYLVRSVANNKRLLVKH